MRINTVAGSSQAVVRKFLLTEDGPFTIPPGMVILHSEVVVDDSNTEILEVWAALPTVDTQQSKPDQNTSFTKPTNPQTIYTNTVIYDNELEGYNPKSIEDDDEYYY